MSDSLCLTIVEAVADAEGVAPMELERPLYEAIDPEALETVFTDGSGHAVFQYYGYEVTVDHTGDVELERGGG